MKARQAKKLRAMGSYAVPLIEVARSYSRKVNLGNYESEDHFCSGKMQATWEDAATASEAIYRFCRAEVLKSVRASAEERESLRRAS